MIALGRETLEILRAKWKLDLLCLMACGVRRHSRLFDNLPGISKKVLTAALRSLQEDGLVVRHIYAEVPARVEYTLTPLGWSLTTVLMALYEWASDHAGDVEAARAKQRSTDSDAAAVRQRRAFELRPTGT